MTNDSYIAEHWNNQFEPNDSREESIMECPECSGQCTWSSCCGEEIHYGHCTDCELICDEVICPTCKGDGVVSI